MDQGLPQVNRIQLGEPLIWLRSGWRDMSSAPVSSLFYGLTFVTMGWLLHVVIGRYPQYMMALTTGFTLLGPFLAIGLYDVSRRLERGEAAKLRPTLTAWKDNVQGLGLFSIILALAFAGWLRISVVLFALFFTSELPTLDKFWSQVFSADDNLAFLLVYFACGAGFATLVFAISVVSIPLMLGRNTDTVSAIFVSVQALFLNPAAMALWALLIAVLTALGMLTAYFGLAVTMPLIGHATWHAYRRLVQD